MGMGRRGVRFLEYQREQRLPGPFYADDLVLCGELEEDLRAMVKEFFEVCRRGMKVNAGKTKVMVMNGEKGLDHQSVRFTQTGFIQSMSWNSNIWDVFWTNQVQMEQCVVVQWQVGGGLQVPSGSQLMLQICSFSELVLHETLLVPVLICGSQTMLWKEERSRIRAVQMENLRGLSQVLGGWIRV